MAAPPRDTPPPPAVGYAQLTGTDEAARIRADALACAERVLAAAHRSAADVRRQAELEADSVRRSARAEAAREANGILGQALARARQEQLQVAAQLDAALAELLRLQERNAELLDRLGTARDRFRDACGPEAAAECLPTSVPPASYAASGPVGPPLPAGPCAAPMVEAPPERATLVGDIDVVLPARVDRVTVEVLTAVLREQPGIVVRPPARRDQAMVLSVAVERELPLIPILLELPRIAAVRDVPAPADAAHGQARRLVVELDG